MVAKNDEIESRAYKSCRKIWKRHEFHTITKNNNCCSSVYFAPDIKRGKFFGGNGLLLTEGPEHFTVG